jgi:hypothetical protein
MSILDEQSELEGQQTNLADFTGDPDHAPAEPEHTPPPPDELVVTGTGQLEMFQANGKRPSRATLSVSIPKIALQHGTAFEKGETVVLQVVAVVTKEGAVDKLDKATGVALEAVAEFGAKVTDVRVVAED